ncbi:MAG TPA: ACT domain-containing protein, partial [Acidimicrobiia bacterium]|nr:ACT domain-containing protein [Acidimicrobiia bacterium]
PPLTGGIGCPAVVQEFAVWALGADRPGIVAAVTGVLFQMGCNLKDCSMTVLSRHFAMMMLVEGPDDLDPAALEEALREAEDSFDLTVAVRPLNEGAMLFVEGEPYIVSVYGSDHPGIVHRIASVLADLSVNITDVNTRVIGEDEEPVYAMLLEVTLPRSLEPGDLDARLQEMAKELGVDASLHPADADVL